MQSPWFGKSHVASVEGRSSLRNILNVFPLPSGNYCPTGSAGDILCLFCFPPFPIIGVVPMLTSFQVKHPEISMVRRYQKYQIYFKEDTIK